MSSSDDERPRWRILLDWVRRIGAVALVGVAIAYSLASKNPCERTHTVTTSGKVRSVVDVMHCAPVSITAPLACFWLLGIVLLLAPDFNELSIPGFLSLRREVAKHADEIQALHATLTAQATATSDAHSSASAEVTLLIPDYFNGPPPPGQITLPAATFTSAAPTGAATQSIDPLRLQRLQEREEDRYSAANRLLDLLVSHPDDRLQGAELAIYLPNTDDVLMPLGKNIDDVDSHGFRSGIGVVGRAFATGGVTTAKGAATQEGLEALTPARRQHLADVTSVCAEPLVNAQDQVIGVLSAASRDRSYDVTTQARRTALSELGITVTRVLVDLMRVGGNEDAPGDGQPGQKKGN